MKKDKIKSLLISAFALLSLAGCNLSSSSEDSLSSNIEQSSNNPISSSSNVTYDKAEMIYDFNIEDKDEKDIVFSLDEFNETFTFDNMRVYGKNGVVGTPGGFALYIYDINHDGYRDFCQTIHSGSGMIDSYVSVYDYHSDKIIYELEDRMHFDYEFYLDQDNSLAVKMVEYFYGETMNAGKLQYNTANGVFISWDNIYKIKGYGISVNYAAPFGTYLNNHKKDEIYTFNVDSYSIFHLRITLDVSSSDVDIPATCPCSIKYNGDKFTMKELKLPDANKGEYHFEVYFPLEEKIYEIEMNISSFAKTIRFNVDNSEATIKRVKGLFNWSYLLNEDNVKKIRSDFDLSFERSDFRQIHLYSDKENIAKGLELFDCVVYEVDPNYYPPSNIKLIYEYHFETENETYSIRITSQFIEIDGRYYKLRDSLNFITSGDIANCFGFSFQYQQIKMYKVDDEAILKTINNTQDFYFKKEINNGRYSSKEASYKFTIGGYTYYVIDSKTFTDDRYYYSIISERDFSSLFE